MTETEHVIDAHVHLAGPAGARLLLERFAEQPWDQLLAKVLTWTEPLAHPILDRLASWGRHGWPQAFSRAMSELGWPQVQAIFQRLGIHELLSDMDHEGISHAWVHTIEPYFKTEPVARLIAPWPDRFSLSVGIDPYHPDPVSRLHSLMAEFPIHGLKLHPSLQVIHPLDPRVGRLMALAEQHVLPVTIHTGTFPFRTGGWENSRLLAPLLDAWRRQPIILAHIGWDQAEEVLAIARKRPWVHVETSWQDPGTIRKAVKQLGEERVLFGSDWPLLKARYALAHVRQALPHGSARQAVLGGNAMRLLRLLPVTDQRSE
ncbi:MAG: amidohydrolase family protein [Candidatus Sericytochromatia bacterium]|nr:amidohydrolase family protein [Candidatus Sericytochromatia bacterium]